MAIRPGRTIINRRFAHVYENPSMTFGYTEIGFKLADLQGYFPRCRLLELKQVHSRVILSESEIEGGGGNQGDGIILEKKGKMAVIKTADCVPLFFWDRGYSTGGILHIGWRGLQQGIEKQLIVRLEEKSIPLDGVSFYLGPGIERDCYEVGKELFDQFKEKSYCRKIFSPSPHRRGKFLLDIKRGVTLSLGEAGIPPAHITDSGICTSCETARFPSYRRQGKTDNRIYNFLCLRE